MRTLMRALVGLAVAAATITPAATSQAAEQNGYIDPTELIFYYNSVRYDFGSGSDFYSPKPSLAGYKFLSEGPGRGQYVKNNSASVQNTYGVRARVYYNSNYGGKYDEVRGFVTRDLLYTYNDNASFRWVS